MNRNNVCADTTSIITRNTIVKGEVHVWGIPKCSWELDREREEREAALAEGQTLEPLNPFRYELCTNKKMYIDGAVLIHTTTVGIGLPSGINLLKSALDTLQNEREIAYREYKNRLDELDQKIKQLGALMHIKDENQEV